MTAAVQSVLVKNRMKAQELWRDPQEELQKALNIQPGWPEITSDLGARGSAGPPVPPTSWMRRPVEGEDGAMA